MNSPKVSIIVPIYNTASLLPKCLDSILSQTYQNLEVILIDDGSTDDTPKTLKKYAKKDPRIITIHQKNSGQSAARNHGLKLATGEYVSFIDSDDSIAPTFIAKLLAPFQNSKGNTSLSISSIRYKRTYEKTSEDVYTTPIRPRKKSESKKAYILYLFAITGSIYACINKLFLAKYAKLCHFDESINFAEDTKFVLDYLKKSHGELTFIYEPLYQYNYGTATSTVTATAIYWKNWQASYQNLKTWLGQNPTARERFWLHLVHLRWRISHLRSIRRAKAAKKHHSVL